MSLRPGRRAVAVAAVALAAVLVAACNQEPAEDLGARQLPTATVTTTTATADTTTTDAPPAGTTTTIDVQGCPVVPRNAPDPNRPRYRMQLIVHLHANVVDGEQSVRFTPERDLDHLVFRLWPNGPRPAGAGARLVTGEVRVDGRPVTAAAPEPTTLVVQATVRAGRTVEITLPWQLTLPGPVNDRISRSGDAVRLGSFFPILAWEPGVGWATEPPTSGFAEASTAPTADFDVTINVPPGLGVLATGVAAPSEPARWRAEAARDFALSIGRFATRTASTADGVTVTVGVHAGLPDDPQRYLDKVVRVLADHSRRYGPYPWPSYTLALTPELGGGIEYPMHVMQGSGTLGRTTTHEVAHMWFYGLVGNNQGRDPWLDEGVSTFAESRIEGAGTLQRDIPPQGRGRAGAPMTFWEQRQSIYFRSVYVQGGQAVAALGPLDRVDCALRVYVARMAHRIATPADFLAAVSEVFPDASTSLAPFGVLSAG